MLFCIVLAAFLETINLWASRRGRIEALSKNLISVARAIEEHCSQKQLAKMGKVTHWTRIFAAVYAYDVAMIIILFVVFPVYQGKLVADIPGLVDNPVIYWVSWAVEAVVFSAGSISYYSFMAYHIEICVLVVHLYRCLCKNFEGCSSREDIRSCVDIHRRLIDVTKMFDVLFSRSLLQLVTCGCTVIIVSTTVILFSVYPEPLFVVILLTIFSVYLAPNYLGDLISVSYEHVGISVYRSPWIDGSFASRKALTLVILISQRGYRLKAGFLEKLGMQQFSRFLNR